MTLALKIGLFALAIRAASSVRVNVAVQEEDVEARHRASFDLAGVPI